MRLDLRTAALSAAAASAVLLGGCGFGGDSESSTTSPPVTATSSSPTGSTPSETASPAGDAEAQQFCTEAIEAGSELDDAFTAAGNDQSQLPDLLQQAVDRFSSVTPPAAIEPDWTALIGGLQQLSTAIQGIDLNDPNAGAALQQALGEVESTVTTAQANVETYIRDQCGIDPGTGGELTESSSPTS